MEVVQGWTTLPLSVDVAMTIGVFDGVHLGHQALLRQVVRQAEALHGRAVVMTFYPHPRSILAPDSPWAYLCSLEERIERIAELGPDLLMVMPFTAEFADIPAEAFVEQVVQSMRLHDLYVGIDSCLGRGGQGDVPMLAALGERLGFRVHAFPPVEVDGQIVSSTRIRELVQSGQVAEVVSWLGRPFSLRGEVVSGYGQGRFLGFPTANLRLDPRQILPADGVYAVMAQLPHNGPGSFPGLGYVGRRPTFGTPERVVEVHLFDFSADLVGRELRAEFRIQLRPDRRFANVDELMEQMRRDEGRAREMLGASSG